jgi:hypothetical protein
MIFSFFVCFAKNIYISLFSLLTLTSHSFNFSLVIILNRIYKTLLGFIKKNIPTNSITTVTTLVYMSPTRDISPIKQHITRGFYNINKRIVLNQPNIFWHFCCTSAKGKQQRKHTLTIALQNLSGD